MSRTIDVEQSRLAWRKEQEEAKRAAPNQAALPAERDIVSGCHDPLPIETTETRKRGYNNTGWSQQDTLIAASEEGVLRTQALAPFPQTGSKALTRNDKIAAAPERAVEEQGLFGTIANVVADLAISLKNHFLAEKHRVNAAPAPPHPYRFQTNPFESHNMSEEDIKEYRRLETALAKWLDKADSLRRDIGMDAVFLLLVQLMMQGKKEEFHMARKKLSESYTDRARDLDARLKVMEELSDGIRNNSWWNNFTQATAFAGTAALVANTALGGTPAASAWLLVPCVIGLLNQVAGDPIAKYTGKATAAVTGGDEKIHAARLQIALTLAVTGIGLLSSGLPDETQATAAFKSLTGVTGAIGQAVQAKYGHEEHVRKGKLTTLEGSIRKADEKIRLETREDLKKPLDTRNQLYRSLIEHLQQLDEINKQSIRNIA